MHGPREGGQEESSKQRRGTLRRSTPLWTAVMSTRHESELGGLGRVWGARGTSREWGMEAEHEGGAGGTVGAGLDLSTLRGAASCGVADRAWLVVAFRERGLFVGHMYFLSNRALPSVFLPFHILDGHGGEGIRVQRTKKTLDMWTHMRGTFAFLIYFFLFLLLPISICKNLRKAHSCVSFLPPVSTRAYLFPSLCLLCR
ncbi:hypothetical protein VTK73DRAFT_4675 [Phialemonium thermophilum]|uniref:Uncharacterized protein n=1 Tax=Phialemonium thermophilum TaxID=223376 RepID=A0ABR3V7V7_9PEZI